MAPSRVYNTRQKTCVKQRFPSVVSLQFLGRCLCVFGEGFRRADPCALARGAHTKTMTNMRWLQGRPGRESTEDIPEFGPLCIIGWRAWSIAMCSNRTRTPTPCRTVIQKDRHRKHCVRILHTYVHVFNMFKFYV